MTGYFMPRYGAPQNTDKICPRCAIVYADQSYSYDIGDGYKTGYYYQELKKVENHKFSEEFEYWYCDSCNSVYMFRKVDQNG